MLKFDEATTRLLDDGYLGADVSRRRRASFDALSPSSGEAILDLGCGTGLLTVELARAVGTQGRVTGLDPSKDMLSAARMRSAEFENVELFEGTAQHMPFPDGHFDKAVSIQVFEYFEDACPALRELHRVLRPRGRLVIADTHWDSLCWHSEQPARMSQMIEIWDNHLANRCVPATLPSGLLKCGFEPTQIIPMAFCDTSLKPDGLALMMIRLMQAFAWQKGYMSEVAAKAWAQEQYDLAEQGRFFMSITHFIWVAHKA